MKNPDIEYAREVLRLEAEAVAALRDLLDERFARAVEMILGCEGLVVTTGMGKSGLIARKISATLASTGTPSIYLHPAEALHGDLGRVAKRDVVMALSRSGEVPEMRRLIPSVKRIGAALIALTAAPTSALASHADCVLRLGADGEACPIGLAPTTSTTAQLALGDALAMAVAKRRKFSREDFALFHPGGSLGRSLLRVADLMHGKDAAPPARIGESTREALVRCGGMGRRPGALAVVDAKGALKGLLTDGDLRRRLLRDDGFLDRPIEEVMTATPTFVSEAQLAAEAWRLMKERNFDELPVVDDQGGYAGLLDVQDLLESGVTEAG